MKIWANWKPYTAHCVCIKLPTNLYQMCVFVCVYESILCLLIPNIYLTTTEVKWSQGYCHSSSSPRDTTHNHHSPTYAFFHIPLPEKCVCSVQQNSSWCDSGWKMMENGSYPQTDDSSPKDNILSCHLFSSCSYTESKQQDQNISYMPSNMWRKYKPMCWSLSCMYELGTCNSILRSVAALRLV